MAGIFANIDSDISKIRQLKSEIEKVKKALTSINVKVDIDIAKGMEAQLKSLTAQYDALVQKVAQAEAKIAESTARINKSAETIIKAQEQMAKAASGQGVANAQGASGGNTAATNAQTASVQAQAKAYDELKDAIEGYLGTMEGNARYIAETESAISNVKKNISLLRKEIDAKGGIANEAQLNNLAHYTEELERLKIQLQDARRDLKTDLRINVAGEGSLAQLRNQLLQMQRVWDGMVESVRNSPIGQEFAKSIDVLNKQVSELEQTMGRYQRNVGNYASGWNGLGMSIQQIGRELPSLAMGWNTFFLAISNNLPILTDEIKRAKDEYNRLKEAGQQATPVWKQVVSSLLSWQTALTVGITLLTLYGGEIINWAKGLFNAEKQIDTVKEVSKSFNETMLKGAQDAQSEIVQLNLLYKAATDASKGLDERNKAVDELQKKYPSYFGDLSDEVILLGNAKTAYDKLSQSILASAKARAAVETMKDNEKELITLNTQLELAQQNLESAKRLQELQQSGNIRNTAGAAFAPTSAGSKELADAADEVRKYESEITGLQAKINTLTASNQKLAESVNIGDLLFNPSEGGGGKNDIANAKSYLDELAKLREENEDREIDLMKEGTEKQLAEINLRYDREIEAVKKLRAELEQAQGGKLTTEQVSTFDAAVAGIEAGRKRDTGNVWNEKINRQEQAWNRYLQEYGTFQQKRQAITEEYNRKMTEAQTAGEAAILQKQMEEALSDLNMDKLKQEINWELVFSDLGNASKESLEKVKKQLKDFKDSNEYKEMSVEQIQVVDEALNKIQGAIIDKGGLLGDLPNQLEELRKAQEELNKAQEEYNQALKGGTETQKESSQKKLNEAQKKLVNQQGNVNKATDKAIGNFQLLSGTLTELGEASEMSLSQLGNLVQGIAGAFGESGSKIGGIIGSVFSLLDSIGSQGLDGFVGNIFKSVGNAAYGAWDTIFGWTGIDFGGDSDPHLEEDLQRLSQSNQDLEAALDNLSEKMDSSSVAEAMGIYSQQVDNINKQMRNTQEAMLRSHAAYSDGFFGIGGDHSSGYEINEGMTASEWKEVSKVVGRAVNDAEDFFNLTSEEMWRVANEATSVYSKIKDLADNGYRDAAQYMDEYISYWKELEELQDQYREKLTSTSFDAIKDDFRNALLDMEDSTEDFAKNFEKMMQQAMLESFMTEKYDEQLKSWYKYFSQAMEDGALSKMESLFLESWWGNITNDATREWEALRESMGWDTGTSSQQSATARGFETMTQDQASELNGRSTALYESSLRQEAIQQGISNIAEDARNIIAQSYLELQQISENTGAIIKPIRQIQEDIAEVRRNTAKI